MVTWETERHFVFPSYYWNWKCRMRSGMREWLLLGLNYTHTIFFYVIHLTAKWRFILHLITTQFVQQGQSLEVTNWFCTSKCDIICMVKQITKLTVIYSFVVCCMLLDVNLWYPGLHTEYTNEQYNHWLNTESFKYNYFYVYFIFPGSYCST
jgi:hypothetical protein